MAEPIDKAQQVELRDSEGRSLGNFVHENVARELREEVSRLQSELERARVQRNQLYATFWAWATRPITEEELKRVPVEEDCLPLESFIGNLEKYFPPQ